jgi:hypothetical protein
VKTPGAGPSNDLSLGVGTSTTMPCKHIARTTTFSAVLDHRQSARLASAGTIIWSVSRSFVFPAAPLSHFGSTAIASIESQALLISRDFGMHNRRSTLLNVQDLQSNARRLLLKSVTSSDGIPVDQATHQLCCTCTLLQV